MDAAGVAGLIDDFELSSGSVCVGNEFARVLLVGAGVASHAPGGRGVAIDDQFG